MGSSQLGTGFKPCIWFGSRWNPSEYLSAHVTTGHLVPLQVGSENSFHMSWGLSLGNQHFSPFGLCQSQVKECLSLLVFC